MTLLQLLLESMMIMDIPDWGWCPWWRFGWSAYDLRKLCLKFGWNLLSLKASRTLSKMDDISGVFAGVDDDFGCSWLGLVSLMTFWMVCTCPEEAMFKIWLKYVEFESIKNSLKDGWHCWRFGGCWRFLTGADVLDHDKDVSFKVQQVSVSNFVKIWCLEAEIWSVQFCQIWCGGD